MCMLFSLSSCSDSSGSFCFFHALIIQYPLRKECTSWGVFPQTVSSPSSPSSLSSSPSSSSLSSSPSSSSSSASASALSASSGWHGAGQDVGVWPEDGRGAWSVSGYTLLAPHATDGRPRAGALLGGRAPCHRLPDRKARAVRNFCATGIRNQLHFQSLFQSITQCIQSTLGYYPEGAPHHPEVLWQTSATPGKLLA